MRRLCSWWLLACALALVPPAAPLLSSSAPSVTPGDPIDRALAHLGLTKATARFDPGDMGNFGGAEFKLPFWQSLHGDPYKVPAYSQAISAQLHGDAKNVAPLVTFGTSRVDELVVHGLVGNPIEDAEKKAAKPDPLVGAITEVCAHLGKPLPSDQQGRLKSEAEAVPPAVARQAALILYASVQAYDWRQRAFKAEAKTYDLQKIFARIPANLDSDDLDDELLDFLHRVDFKALFAGAEDLALALDKAVPELAKFKGAEEFHFRWETPLGWVEINGAGKDSYPAGLKRLLTIDTGGDDAYAAGGATLAADNPISVLIDLKGDDTYRSEDPHVPSFGAGVLGYGFLFDLAGKDTYTGVGFSQGSGAFGVGGLWDWSGDDRYTARMHAQGAAQFGIGILADLAGNDRYEGFLGVQGFGFTKGCGLLIDLAGDDEYVANDTKIDFPSAQDANHNTSLAQGCGTGRRADYLDGRSLAGGVGILYDALGNDKYSAGLFAQGAGYWYGVGMLLDDKGDDHYQGVWYVQGSGAHFAVGVLVDGAGNDDYRATHNMAQGAGHDFSLGFLLDRAGNDHYDAPTLSLGAGNANGIGIFWDMAGDDTYRTKGGATMGGANYDARGLRGAILCLGVFIDSGGGKDTYPAIVKAAGNGQTWKADPPQPAPRAPTLGVGIDE